jgi:membrane protein implicated in regulation of membrane protease activity
MFSSLAAWHIWLVIGIVCVIIEIFDPAFFFLALGIGAIATALLALAPVIGNNIPVQVVLFAVFSFIAFLFMRKLGKKVLSHTGGETNVDALKGKPGFVTRDIPADGKGFVKIGGEEWSAIEQEGKPVIKGTKVEIIGIDGNKVVVRVNN